jgi:hypothetical protein
MEERPVLVSTLAGNLGEVLNLLAPRLTDVLFARADRTFADSAAARTADPAPAAAPKIHRVPDEPVAT